MNEFKENEAKQNKFDLKFKQVSNLQPDLEKRALQEISERDFKKSLGSFKEENEEARSPAWIKSLNLNEGLIRQKMKEDYDSLADHFGFEEFSISGNKKLIDYLEKKKKNLQMEEELKVKRKKLEMLKKKRKISTKRYEFYNYLKNEKVSYF